LEIPSDVFLLERDLREISGLTYSSQNSNLLAINDEKGYIYSLDTYSGKVQNRIDFGRSNDYEGLAYSEGIIYIAESNGEITTVDESSQQRIEKIKNDLSRRNDIEGLTYNPSTSTFLLAAKGRGSIKGKNGKKKAIFTFDPISGNVSDIPFVKINLEKAVKSFASDPSKNFSDITNYQLKRVSKFSPSGIAVHPVSKRIYVLSSRGKLLVIFNQKGGLQGIHFLNERQHAQPEGICFGPNHTLYISNEGRAGKASLFSFVYQQ